MRSVNTTSRILSFFSAQLEQVFAIDVEACSSDLV